MLVAKVNKPNPSSLDFPREDLPALRLMDVGEESLLMWLFFHPQAKLKYHTRIANPHRDRGKYAKRDASRQELDLS
ncbi:hypothetical protein [Schlesneria paludicola]|uniref:hypothetical protein n=1 Tax=Schlesneria paludicola TaxID=360056 RepID=UPI0002EC5874|nr:hypothetical protein [Schlesneria paludicola]